MSSEKLPSRGMGRRVADCQRAFKAELTARLARFDVQPSHWYVLNELWTEPSLTQVGLSQLLGIEKASSTAVLDDLERRGFIQRVRNDSDRRKVDISLTPAGRRLTQKLIECAVGINAKARRGIGRSDFVTFLKVLDTMTRNLREREA